MRALAFVAIAVASPLAALIMFVPGNKDVAHATGVCSGGEALTTAFGEWFTPQTDISPQLREVRRIVPSLTGQAVAVRLQIMATSPGSQRWTLVLRDPDQRILSILSEQDFGLARGGSSTQWTARLEAAQVSGELVGGGAGVKISFAAGMALPRDSQGTNVFSSQTNQPNWTDPFTSLDGVHKRATEAVGMLVSGMKMPDAQGVLRETSWCCSGAMLTSDIFLTNWHCGGPNTLPESLYWSNQVKANGIVDLGWQSGSAPRRQYAITAVLHTSERLDYALLRLRPTVGPQGATGRALPVKVGRVLATTNQIFVVHHAQCRAKLLSHNCTIENRNFRAWTDPLNAMTGPDLTHRCDTEPGASGAPVFDVAGKMIALHHLGFQKAGAGGQCPSDKLNKAVRIESIYADLQQTKPALFAELPRF